jgi:hypothetical protein
MSVSGEGGPRDPAGRGIEARFVRQGRRGSRMVWVMSVSLGLVVVLLAAIWAAQQRPGANPPGRIDQAEARLGPQSVPGTKPAPAPMQRSRSE